MVKPMLRESPSRLLSLAPSEIFARSFESIFPLGAPQRLAVACSGGGDSLALLLLCKSWIEQRGLRAESLLTALICNHGLRAESTQECRALKRRLEVDFGLATHIFVPDAPLSSLRGNLQQNMRLFRLRKLLGWCVANSVSCLALGHTRDDQIETHTLQVANLLRGRGGMRALRRVSPQGVFLLRPLLSVSRASLRAWLRANDVAWLEDPSNASPRYTRNRIRPVCRRLSHAEQSSLLATGARLRQEEEALEETIRHFSHLHATWHAEGYVCIESRAFLALDNHVALRLLASVARSVGGKRVRQRQVLQAGRAWRARLEAFVEEGDNNNKESAVVSLGRCLLFAKRRVFFATRAALNIESLSVRQALQDDRLWDGRLRIVAPMRGGGTCWPNLDASFADWTCRALTREGVVSLRKLSKKFSPHGILKDVNARLPCKLQLEASLGASLARFESLPWRVREVAPSFWCEGALRALPTFGITLEGDDRRVPSVLRAEEMPRVRFAKTDEQNLLLPPRKCQIFASSLETEARCRHIVK